MTLEEQYRLSCYEVLTTLGNHNNIYLVKHKLSGEIFVKKVLSRFSLNVYKQLSDLQIPGIPKIHALTPPIIHRDLKLSNIILTSENLVYVVDFDTARYYESGQEQDTELLGTKEYAPPEQYGFGQSDARSDIYALGIIFNRLLTGEYPKHQLADGRYRSIISKCIRWDPEERFQTIVELENALHDDISSDIGKLWKMIVALFGYLFFIYLSVTLELTNTKTGIPLTGLWLWHERFFVFLMLLSLIFYNFNYKNIRTRSFLGRSFPFLLRLVLQCLVSFGILVILMIFMQRFRGMQRS